MDALKRLMSDEDYHNLKKLSVNLERFKVEILMPLRDTFASEARRAINYNRRVEVTLREIENILRQTITILGENNGQGDK